MLSKILIIDKRKELSVKYKKSVEDINTSALIARNLKDAISDIQDFEPDLILISDSIDEKLTNFCEKIRAMTYNSRPVIIALSKSADIQDRIAVLNSGADDFLSEPVNIEEFKTRVKAHLRRDIELNLDSTTLLPNKKYVEKSLKRVLNSQNKPAILLIAFENLKKYRSIYSDIAGDKLLQTFVAIAKSALNEEDFFGQINESEFVIITSPYCAEKMAAFLTFAFDTVVPKFYSEQDRARGYTLLKGDRQAGMRVNFVSIFIGGIIDNYNLINSTEGILAKLYSTKKIAKIPSGSNYAIDRVKLTGENSVIQNKLKNSIFIKEGDEALALLLRTTLELQGYDIENSLDENTSNPPSIIILDSKDDLSELEFCRNLKQLQNFADTKIIVTTTVHDKTSVLNSGADLYLPKPYEISDLVRWVEYFLNT